MEVRKRSIRHNIKVLIVLVISISILLLVGSIYIKLTVKEKVDSELLIATLEKSSELTTSTLKYKGLYKFKDDGIRILNRSDFIIEYDAIVRAGIDISEVDISSDNLTKTISISIPKARILDVKITNVSFMDSKFSLFNTDSKEDAERAKVEAEKDTKEKMTNMGILEMADTQAEALIKGIIQDSIPKGYEIKVKSND